MDTRIYSDLTIDGSVRFAQDLTEFPANPIVGTAVMLDGRVYIYTKIATDIYSWLPMSNKQSAYVHVQAVAASTWTINHNLGSNDYGIFIYDNDHNLIIANHKNVNANTISVSLSSATTGTAVVFVVSGFASNTISSAEVKVGNITLTDNNGRLAISGADINSDYVRTNTTEFGGTVLDSTDNTVQKALVQLDTVIENMATNISSLTAITSAVTSIQLTGDTTGLADFDGVNATIIETTLADSGVTAGTYTKVTVDAKGRATGGSNPTTLSGYGITDAYTKTETDSRIQAVVGAAPAALDTLAEIATQLAADESAATALTTTVAAKADKSYVDSQIASVAAGNVSSASKLATARTISATGDASWSVSFDGSANATAALTLANSGVTAGTYTKVTVDAKGRVTLGTTLSAGDIPNLDWSKITSGRPTTISGYGITDAYTKTEVTSAISSATPLWSSITNTPTTLAGYGITDAQSKNNTLTSLSGLSTASTGLIKLTNGVASLDSNTYLTANQNITVSGDATGSGTTAISLTLSNSGVTAGTYNNAATSITPFTVDAKGRVTGTGSAVTITPAWSSITSKPTTRDGYGITDVPKTDGTGATGTWAINTTGNANYATSAGNADTVDGYHASSFMLAGTSPTFSAGNFVGAIAVATSQIGYQSATGGFTTIGGSYSCSGNYIFDSATSKNADVGFTPTGTWKLLSRSAFYNNYYPTYIAVLFFQRIA